MLWFVRNTSRNEILRQLYRKIQLLCNILFDIGDMLQNMYALRSCSVKVSVEDVSTANIMRCPCCLVFTYLLCCFWWPTHRTLQTRHIITGSHNHSKLSQPNSESCSSLSLGSFSQTWLLRNFDQTNKFIARFLRDRHSHVYVLPVGLHHIW